jgi:hypothetical protein
MDVDYLLKNVPSKLDQYVINKEFCDNTSKMVGKFIVLGHKLTYFVKHETKGRKLYTENEVISMLEFLESLLIQRPEEI